MHTDDAQTQGRAPGGSPLFALDFRAEGVALMRLADDGWTVAAFCAWRPAASESEAPSLEAPGRLAAAIDADGAAVDVWLPDDLVLSRIVPAEAVDPAASPRQAAHRALSGLAMLRPDALEIAAARTGRGVAVKAVERSVLDQAFAHARRWGLTIRSVRSQPGDPDFPDGAVFRRAAEAPPAPAPKRGGLIPGAVGVVGVAAALTAVAILALESPREPDAPAAPVVVAEAPSLTSPAQAAIPPQAAAHVAEPPAQSRAAAKPAPDYRSLRTEVAYSAPVSQFTPVAEAPNLTTESAQHAPAAPKSVRELAAVDAGALTIQPGEPPLEVAAAAAPDAAAGAVSAEPPAAAAPTPPKREQASPLAPPRALGGISVDAAAGAAGEQTPAPGEAAPPLGQSTPPKAMPPASRKRSDPPGGLAGLDEMGDADFAALSLEEGFSPPAPPEPAQDVKTSPPPAPRPALRPGASPEEPLQPAGEAEDRPPVTEFAPETASRPKSRPKTVAAAAAADAPVEITALAPASVRPPHPRPASIRQIPAMLAAAAERAKAEREKADSPASDAQRRSTPTSASIAKTATQHTEWETLDGFLLIGVFERVGGRSALMRLPNGDVRRVESGDRIGRWTVASVEKSAVRLTLNGRSETLHLPSAL